MAAAWEIQYEPANPVAGQEVDFHAERVNPGSGDGDELVWDFGDGRTAAGQEVTNEYSAAGEYTVTLRRAESDGTSTVEDQVKVKVAPPPNTPPSAAFTFTPGSPLVGEDVLFTGGSDPDGNPITREWDFGDLSPVSFDVSPSHAYSAVGSYTVVLTVTDGRGGFDSRSRSLTVAPQPGTPRPGDGLSAGDGSARGDGLALGDAPQRETAPLRMKPFPIVRIAGAVLPGGALVRILSVSAPRGARISVRCSGRSCPVRAVARTSATRLVRFHRFERRLGAGVTLELFVRKAARIGKYTRFLIRAGKAPARTDRCLMPGRERPVRCP